MTRQDEMGRRVSFLEQQVSAIVAKVDLLVAESNKQREEMKEIRNDMKELRNEIRDAIKHMQSLTTAAVVGIAAITVATWAFMWTTARNSTPPPQPPAQAAQYQAAETPN